MKHQYVPTYMATELVLPGCKKLLILCLLVSII